MGDSKHLKRLKDVNTKPVDAEEVYFIDGTLYVSRKFLSKYYNLNTMTIVDWEKKGLVSSNKGYAKLILYEFDEVLKFREDMVNNGKKAPNVKDNKGLAKDRDLEGKEYAEVELQKKKNEVILQDFKIKEAKGDLVKSDTVDKAIAEFGAYFVGFLRNSRITLSRDLEGMNQDEMFAFLDIHYGEFVNDVSKRVNHDQPEDLPTIYDELHKRIVGE